MSSKIGTMIKKRLIDKKWSQRKLAVQAGLSITCVNKLITGVNKDVGTRTIFKLAKTLDIPPNDLFDLLNF